MKSKKKTYFGTRFWFAVIAFIVNMLAFCTGVLFFHIDPTSLGTGLALINTPLYSYIFGRTVRGPNEMKKDMKETNEAG